MAKKLLSLLLSGVLAVGSMSLNGCIETRFSELNQSNEETIRNIEAGKDLFIPSEGFLVSGNVVTNRAAELAKALGMAQSGSKDYSRHMEYAEMASDQGSKIVCMGLSWGCGRLVQFAYDCQERGVEIDTLIFLDGHPGRIISDNVHYVLNYIAENGGILGGRHLTDEDFQDPARTAYENHVVEGRGHLDIAKDMELMAQIQERLEERLQPRENAPQNE